MLSYLYKIGFFCLLLMQFFIHQAIAEETDYFPYPQPDIGYVTDHAGILNLEEETLLERWLLQVEEKSNVEIFVVTIKSLKDYEGTRNRSIETFATALFDTYGIGNMPKNDGILLVISKGDRKARIELGKYYSLDYNIEASQIMQNIIVPEFKQGDYPSGITNGVKAIIEDFADMRVTFPWYILWTVIAGVGLLLTGISCIISGKRGWGYVFVGIGIVLILFAIYFLKELNRTSSSIGGSGGFDGGSSGGGGATGSW